MSNPPQVRGKIPYLLTKDSAIAYSGNKHVMGHKGGDDQIVSEGIYGKHLCSGPDLARGSGSGQP